MAYDPELTDRLRHALVHLDGIKEQRMMGGVCFMRNGHMICGANCSKSEGRRFMFRIGKDNQDKALQRNGAVPMEMGGRVMRGRVFVDHEVCPDPILGEWIALARSFVDALPPKPEKKPKKKR
ncbi:MAG: TfoX/Sxy family protein [Hyphomicrobiales bacterium]|nr:TfoX/Sxy family protein [Hyphomicrobiales bacterium]